METQTVTFTTVKKILSHTRDAQALDIVFNINL